MIRNPAEVALIDQATAVLRRVCPDTRAEHPVLLGEVVVALRRAIDDGIRDLRAPRPDDEVAPAERGVLVSELQDIYLQVREHALVRRFASHEAVLEGLERLRSVATPAQLLERVTREVCTSCGFERGVLSKVQGAEWILEGAHFVDDSPWAEDFVRFGAETRPTLTHSLLETEMARRRAPAISTDAMSDPRTHKPFVEHSNTRDYVAAPIMPRGRVIGFIHADHHFSEQPVGAEDRDSLWAFTTGFAHVYERAVLLERLREQRDRVQEMVSSTEAVMGSLSEGAIRLDGTERERSTVRGQTASLATAAPGGASDAPLLTPREIEVLSLMAAGATNAVIARELFISEGTVKSHVKRILRKLRASNRAEAVSRFLRFEVQQRDPLASHADN